MNTTRTLVLSFVLLVGLPSMARAQTGSASTKAVTASLKGIHDLTSGNILKTAEMLDEAIYAFKPTEDVRTAGQILAHVANAQYAFCSSAAGEEAPAHPNFEETATTKADIVAALKGAFGYCNGVYDAMTDAQGAMMKPFFGNEMAASAILSFNTAHNYEHYGNLVTYMRIKGIVPPSSM